ncbi:MAG: T9SS type A sorting domain-containing protein [Parafilimonas sp.]|nr:T9SS type A sorting domain-containing protein [Parafilimonas sp.]
MKHIFTIVFFCIFSTSIISAQSGTLDTSFGVEGKIITPFYSNELIVWDAAMQKDSKIVLSGEGSLILTDTLSGISVIRYQTNGLLDSSFGVNGRAVYDFGYYSTGKAIAAQADGKILSAGWEVIDPFNNDKNNVVVVRFLNDGKIDSTFGKNGELIVNFGKNPVINDVVIQPDSKIIIGGSLGPDFFLIRCDDDGKIDSSFGTNGYVTTSFSGLSSIRSIVLQSDNKILVGGSADGVAAFARYTSNGSLDQSFGNQGKFTYNFNTEYSIIYNIILLPDGSFIASGKVGGFNENMLISKFNSDGTANSTFANNGNIVIKFSQLQSKAVSAFLQSDNKIVVTGSAYKAFTGGDEEFTLCRLLPNGNFDSTFGINGLTVTDFGEQYLEYTIASFSINDKILTVGAAGTRDIPEGSATLLAQYNNDLSRRQILITKIKHWIQHHNGIEWNYNSNISSYVVQRSYDGIHFSSIARITASNTSNYTYADPSPLAGNNYYRLQTTSSSGAVNYSNVIAVTNSDIKISPNPATNSLHIEGLLSSNKTKITVVDFAGNIVISQQLTPNSGSSYNLNIVSLKPGNYLLKIESQADVVTKSFVKE